MPLSKKLSSRVSKYIGVDDKSALGPRARGLGIEALKGHSAWSTAVIDFAEIAVPSRTALGITPTYISVTDVGVVGGTPTTVANSSNGYLLVYPGDTDVTGLNLHSYIAAKSMSNTTVVNHASAGTNNNVTISSSREYFFGMRAAISCSTAWSGATGGALFFGLASNDTGVMTAATGALDGVAACAGFHFLPDGTGTLVKRVSAANQTAALPITATTLAHSSTSFRARDFHDYVLYGRWNVSTGVDSANNLLEAYIDGKLVAKIVGGAHPSLATLWGTTVEIINGTGADSAIAITEIVTAMPRYTALSGQ